MEFFFSRSMFSKLIIRYLSHNLSSFCHPERREATAERSRRTPRSLTSLLQPPGALSSVFSFSVSPCLRGSSPAPLRTFPPPDSPDRRNHKIRGLFSSH